LTVGTTPVMGPHRALELHTPEPSRARPLNHASIRECTLAKPPSQLRSSASTTREVSKDVTSTPATLTTSSPQATMTSSMIVPSDMMSATL
jgi:hypothetical protein